MKHRAASRRKGAPLVEMAENGSSTARIHPLADEPAARLFARRRRFGPAFYA
jgi:hypothetical protein